MITSRNCFICDKQFYAYSGQLKYGRGKYCSKECQTIGQITKILKKCKTCNKDILVRPSRMNENDNNYCSRKCLGIDQRMSVSSFWNYVDRKSENECWEWVGTRNPYTDYGLITINQKLFRAHRLAYLFTVQGPIQPSMLVCHTCDNPPCCNPHHLFLGTTQDNMDDMVQKGRSLTGEKHPRCKLDEFDVKQILLLKNILKTYTVAKTYKVDPSTINSIWTRKT